MDSLLLDIGPVEEYSFKLLIDWAYVKALLSIKTYVNGVITSIIGSSSITNGTVQCLAIKRLIDWLIDWLIRLHVKDTKPVY